MLFDLISFDLICMYVKSYNKFDFVAPMERRSNRRTTLTNILNDLRTDVLPRICILKIINRSQCSLSKLIFTTFILFPLVQVVLTNVAWTESYLEPEHNHSQQSLRRNLESRVVTYQEFEFLRQPYALEARFAT